MLLSSIRLDGFLSFPPGSPAIPLQPLNVLIGPNGSGKSNLIEAIELLHAMPTSFARAIRDGGGAQEWIWKGANSSSIAQIEAIIESEDFSEFHISHMISFCDSRQSVVRIFAEIVLEETGRTDPATGEKDRKHYYYKVGDPKSFALTRMESGYSLKHVTDFSASESVLSQRKGEDVYPILTSMGQQYERIQTFREWSFGRFAAVRQPQSASASSDILEPDASNLALVLHEIERSQMGVEFNRLLSRFLPRFERFSTRVHGGTVQFYLHEVGVRTPIPSIRVSDGTIRFLAILALLLAPEPAPLVCIEEPELGLHPDAVGLLADLLVEASRRMQLIVTTHSDALVSGLSDDPTAVLVCESNGGTQTRRVDATEVGPWLDRYRLGEVWRIGELGGNP